MATKNLSRTVIEGGRYNRNKQDRRNFNRSYRSQNTRLARAAKVLLDPDDLGPVPKRQKVRKDFFDRTGPLYRWLRKQVGKSWDRVFSELTSRFDTRTTAGRHVVEDHLLSSITLKMTDIAHTRVEYIGPNDYYVDDNGLLQRREPTNRRKRRFSYGFQHREQKILKWVNNRLVMDYGVSIFWMLPEEIRWVHCGHAAGRDRNGMVFWSSRCYRKHRIVTGLELVYFDIEKMSAYFKSKLTTRIVPDSLGRPIERYYREVEHRECQQGGGKYRQGPRFSSEDLVLWNKLTAYEKYHLLHPGSVTYKDRWEWEMP